MGRVGWVAFCNSIERPCKLKTTLCRFIQIYEWVSLPISKAFITFVCLRCAKSSTLDSAAGMNQSKQQNVRSVSHCCGTEFVDGNGKLPKTRREITDKNVDGEIPNGASRRRQFYGSLTLPEAPAAAVAEAAGTVPAAASFKPGLNKEMRSDWA